MYLCRVEGPTANIVQKMSLYFVCHSTYLRYPLNDIYSIKSGITICVFQFCHRGPMNLSQYMCFWPCRPALIGLKLDLASAIVLPGVGRVHRQSHVVSQSYFLSFFSRYKSSPWPHIGKKKRPSVSFITSQLFLWKRDNNSLPLSKHLFLTSSTKNDIGFSSLNRLQDSSY